MPNVATQPASFSDQWIPIFRSGSQTDSFRDTRVWSDGELDEVVANFDPNQPPPLVIGHPKTDSPAWGWTGALKRAGNTLLAKFSQVPQAVSDAVREGRYRNRSVKLAKGDHGWKLIHVGLLGAAPPAVEGLAPIAFDAEPDGVTVEFSWLDGAGLSVIARGMQKLRELIVAHFGADEADRYAPQDDIDHLNDIADSAAHQPAASDAPQPAAFSRPSDSDEDRVMDEKLKADLDAERAKLHDAETKLAAFAARERVAEAKTIVDAALTDGRLTPAQAVGLPEFLASLDDAVEVEFAAADDATKKISQAHFVREFLAALPKQVELGQRHEGTDGVGTAPADIVNAAREFQTAESAKGHSVPWHEAVTHVLEKH